jgi:hypothetical protein
MGHSYNLQIYNSKSIRESELPNLEYSVMIFVMTVQE